jgi:hypothetical protein
MSSDYAHIDGGGYRKFGCVILWDFGEVVCSGCLQGELDLQPGNRDSWVGPDV